MTLNPNLSYKPLDFGNGLVAGSVNASGQLIALNLPHPKQGYVTLTGAEPFPGGDKWYDQAFVRQYRANLAAPDLPGFGFSFGQGGEISTGCSFPAPAMPLVEFNPTPGLDLEILSFAPWTSEGKTPAAAIQLVKAKSQAIHTRLDYGWSGTVALTRASYAQLTEGGPLPLPPFDYTFTVVDGVLAVDNHHLDQAVSLLIGEFDGTGQLTQILHDWKVTPANHNRSLAISLHGSLELDESNHSWLAVIFGFGRDREEARAQALDQAAANLQEVMARTVQHWQGIDTVIEAAGLEKDLPGSAWPVRQTLAYNLACCPAPASDHATCIITDHQLLPLSWNRDSYWQVQAYLALRKQAQNPAVPAATTQAVSEWVDELIRRHLNWLFEMAERPQGYWGRAYLTNGKCKDFIFQLDQQCYPFLELADYLEVTGDWATVRRLKPRLETILEDLLSRKAPQAWLFPTGETPADDRVEMPYHFSSQLNVWRVLTRLAELEIIETYSPAQLREMAGKMSGDIYRHFTAEYESRPVFAYLTDLAGNFQFYHDANDWPTILAPVWEFCGLDDPVWRSTLEYAFSPANRKGFYPGKFGGLGSIHSPHPWPLGSVQELFLSRLLQDEARFGRTWDRLQNTACWDGNFPEAIDEETGRVASRHWFGWPGSMLTMLLLG